MTKITKHVSFDPSVVNSLDRMVAAAQKADPEVTRSSFVSGLVVDAYTRQTTERTLNPPVVTNYVELRFYEEYPDAPGRPPGFFARLLGGAQAPPRFVQRTVQHLRRGHSLRIAHDLKA